MMIICRLLLFACLLAGRLLAAPYKPYPDAEITPEQWQDYFNTVQAEFADTREEIADAMLVTFRDDASRTYYAFTLPDHPAHPAWITRKAVEEKGVISMEQIGYFAGMETPFAALFEDFLELTEQLRSKVTTEKAE